MGSAFKFLEGAGVCKMSALQFPEWEDMINDAMAKEKEAFDNCFMVKNCDQDGDGNIDKQEFLDGMGQWFQDQASN